MSAEHGDLGPTVKLEIFQGNNLQYMDRVSFNGAIYKEQVTTAVLDVAQRIDPKENFSLFSNEVGSILYAQNCMAPAAECFELALSRQQFEDARDPIIGTYSRNYINALAAHIFSLVYIDPEQKMQNIKWFDSKLPLIELATQALKTFNNQEALLTLGKIYRTIYLLTRERILNT